MSDDLRWAWFDGSPWRRPRKDKRMNNGEPLFDALGIAWRRVDIGADGAGLYTCCHCDGAIEPGPALLADDGDVDDARLMHTGCWKLHEGFEHAMSKDD